MLKSIDILIGLSVVMLVASMAVTVMTGFVNHVRNSRGRNLHQGIADLLQLIDPALALPVVNSIARAILTHPLIRDGQRRMGAVIHREELTKLVMELATGSGPQKLDAEAQAALTKTLAANGIAQPSETLDRIRAAALALEKAHPELSNTERASAAILQEAETALVAKINNWFDQTMDRVSARFTLSARVITFCSGLLLAFALQLDTIALVNRLSVDDAMRDSLVAHAKTVNAPNTHEYEELMALGVVSIPKYPDDFQKLADLRHLTGIIFTTLLLSLGAPFWYGALQQLLQLRSKVEQADDVQRKARQAVAA